MGGGTLEAGPAATFVGCTTIPPGKAREQALKQFEHKLGRGAGLREPSTNMPIYPSPVIGDWRGNKIHALRMLTGHRRSICLGISARAPRSPLYATWAATIPLQGRHARLARLDPSQGRAVQEGRRGRTSRSWSREGVGPTCARRGYRRAADDSPLQEVGLGRTRCAQDLLEAAARSEPGRGLMLLQRVWGLRRWSTATYSEDRRQAGKTRASRESQGSGARLGGARDLLRQLS